MKKVVLHKSHGGFSLTRAALELLGLDSHYGIDRDSKDLVAVVELLGDESSPGRLKIVEIPESAYFVIVDKDGVEEIYYSDSPITMLS